jgi:hypothetical protein
MKQILFIGLICIPTFAFSQGIHSTAIEAGFSEIGITPEKPIIIER